MDQLKRRIHWFDRFQQNHGLLGFPIAVVKKYSEDKGGHQAALLTYYGFLSLFPAVLLAITVVRWLLQSDSALKQRIITSITNYFPLIGPDLQENLHGFSRTGLPFLLGLAVLLYGLRGAADVFRHTVNHVWRVPEKDRSGFVPALGRSSLIILIAGIGFIGSAIFTSYANAARYDAWLRLLLLAASSITIFSGFVLVTKYSLNRQLRRRELWIGAATTTVGLILLQSLSRYLLAHELKNLNNLYGAFAAVLGFFFLIYIQSQVIVYAMEISSVRALKLWPRKLIGEEKK